MKGRLIPVFGMVFVTTAMFKRTCMEICAMTPDTIIIPTKSIASLAITINLQISSTNIAMSNAAPNNPSSSQMIEKIISFWASGKYPIF